MADTTIDSIRQDLEFLDDWHDRYSYILDLGDALAPYPEELQDDAHKVRGCASQVWLAVDREDGDSADPVLTFKGKSDARLVSGLIAIVLALYSGLKASEIVATDADIIFKDLGLDEHLTMQRSNGLRSMVKRIRDVAQAALATDQPAT